MFYPMYSYQIKDHPVVSSQPSTFNLSSVSSQDDLWVTSAFGMVVLLTCDELHRFLLYILSAKV